MVTPIPKILAIDDTPANLMTLGAALDGEFELQIATSGPTGIGLALQSVPDLILLDVMMPEVDGFETFTRLAAQPTLKDVPVIFVTALDNFDSEVAGLSLGAADYITKPINVAIARQRIRNLLERERFRKEAQLQAVCLRKLTVAIEQSPASVAIANLDAVLEYVNPRFTEVTGYSAEEAEGLNPRLLQSGLTPPATYLDMWDKLTHGQIWKGELVNKRKNGELYWEETQIAPVKDATGTVSHFVAVKTDISARKELQLQREEILSRLQKIASRVPGVVYQYLLRADGSACFPFASDAIREIYRVTPEEVREDAAKVLAILHPDDLAGVASSIERSAKDMTPWVHEYRVRFDDGTVRWLAGNAVPQPEPGGAVLWHGFIMDVTQRKQAEAVFHGLFEQSAFLAGILDEQGRLLEVNATALRYTDATREQLIGQYFSDTPWWPHPQDRASLLQAMDQAYAGHACSFEACHPVPGGGSIDVLFSATPIRLENQTRLAVIGVDISERKSIEQKLRLAASVFTYTREGITIADARGLIVDVNEAFSRITGYSRDDVIGQNPRMFQSGRHDKAFYQAMWHDLREAGHWSGEVWNRRKNGEVYPELVSISAVRDAYGKTQQYVALFSDISAFKAHESELQRIAHFDALTNLPNRVLLADRLQQAMAQTLRRGQQLAVVYLDLDGFKNVNDQYGHNVGDQLLTTISKAMHHTLREGDTLARIGGDEFVVVLIDLDGLASCLAMLRRLLTSVAEPAHLGDLTLHCSASLGVTFYPQARDMDADQLLRQADQAMYQAKVAGKNQYRIFDTQQDSSLRDRHETLERIGLALAQDEFVLHFQPKVNMRSGQVIGAEALIRWRHPQKGLLSPAAFLPLIEDHPLIVEIGEWVIGHALEQIDTWQAAGLDMPVSVNVAARQLQQGNFVERLQIALAKHPQVKPTNLEIEVLETSALADVAQVSKVIEGCARIGVTFALDDFGTGYSSLTYLKRLCVNVLKIDQSFVRDMLEDHDDLAILQGVIGLAAAFKRQVIAEGVETIEHGTALLRLGCDLAQGYGIARPMPGADIPAWVADWRPDDAWSVVK